MEIDYRLFFDNQAAAQEQVNKIDEITIEQEVDMAWEARFQIPVRVDEQGNWTGDDEDFMRPFCRVRVEIKMKDEPYAALFDGPITGFDSRLSSEPGQSTITLIAQDDTFYLNRVEKVEAYEDKRDDETAAQIFNDFNDLIASVRIGNTPASGSALPSLVVQRGTAMQLLRFLARRQGLHAYVLPGESPGESIGCFNAFPGEPDGLSPFILLGARRNIDSLEVRYCACKPSDAAASSLRITDKQVLSETSRAADAQTMGDETGEESSKVDKQILPPRQGESVDLGQAVDAVVQAAGYSYEVTGSVLEGTYPMALQPYRVITVQAGNTPVSGNYLITKVSHKITRTGYSQSFGLKRNARSARFGSGQSGVPGGIF